MLSDSNPKNEFDVQKYLKTLGRVQAKKDDLVSVFEVG